MMNICVIGNSHVGSLKRGWTRIKDSYSFINITFFAHRADGLSGLDVSDGRLVPNNDELRRAIEFTSGGKSEIYPDNYDIIIIYGAGATVEFSSAGIFYSKSVIAKTLIDFAESTLSFKLLEKIRTITDKRIFIGHVPLLAAKKKLFSTSSNDYIVNIKFINDTVYHNINSEMVIQPFKTIVNGKNTSIEYSKGSKRLGIGDSFDDELHPGADLVHMNDVFGEIWLKEFIEKYLEVDGQKPNV